MTPAPVRRALAAALTGAVVTTAAVGAASAAGAVPPREPGAPPVDLQLLALNDFHGSLEPPGGSSGRLPGFPETTAFGGSEYLATQVRQLEAASKRHNTLTVAAGDLIGATPLLSAAFHDEPAVEALDLIGLDYAGVGNHEFDEGPDELLRIQHGGCHPEDGCADPAQPYDGAKFQYLSANAFVAATGEPLLAPYAVEEVEDVPVGFIGMTLEDTPGVVTPSGVAGLEFVDEAETADRYAAELQAQGVEAIVVLVHEGGRQTAATDVDGCNELTGAITEIVPRMSAAIDVVITGHTHQAYNCREVDGRFVPTSSTSSGRLVTSSSAFGRLVTDIDLTLDRRTGDVLTATADNVPVTRDVARDPAQTELIARYRTLLGPIAGRVVGEAAQPVLRAQETLYGSGSAPVLGESPLGNLIADAQLAATPGAQVALMNPGGVRADLDAGPITYEEAFSVQPFGNYLATVTLTDAQLQCLLEQQFALGTVLQPAGITYSVDPNGTSGTRTDPCSGTRVPDDSVHIAGLAVSTDAAPSYRITVNNFLADGGDNFSVLTQGTERTDVATPEDDLAALVAYLGAHRPVSPPATDRITVLP